MANTIDIIGDTALQNLIISRKITEIEDDVIDKVGDRAFLNCDLLRTVKLSNAKSIADRAFANCSSLTECDLPAVTTIDSNAFYNCGLAYLNLPAVTKVSGYAFAECTELVEAHLPALTTIYTGYAFEGCTKLKKVYLNGYNSGTLGGGNLFFGGCNALTDIYLPGAASAYTGAPWGATNATIHYNYDFSQDGGE